MNTTQDHITEWLYFLICFPHRFSAMTASAPSAWPSSSHPTSPDKLLLYSSDLLYYSALSSFMVNHVYYQQHIPPLPFFTWLYIYLLLTWRKPKHIYETNKIQRLPKIGDFNSFSIGGNLHASCFLLWQPKETKWGGKSKHGDRRWNINISANLRKKQCKLNLMENLLKRYLSLFIVCCNKSNVMKM